MKNKNILISGAGIAGLTLAYWLKRYGFVPTIVEKHPTLRIGGYKIDIRGVALEVINRMNIFASVYTNRTKIERAILVDRSGKQITQMSADLCGTRAPGDLEILRGDLCQILWNQVSDVECIFGDTITQIVQNQDGVCVSFEQNEERHFDLVVGADGLHSTVRKLAFGPEAQFLKELGFYISVFTVPNFLNMEHWEVEYHEPKKFVNLYSTRGDRNATAGFAFVSKSLQFNVRDTLQQQELLKEAFADTGWEVPRLLEAMREAPDFYFDSIAQVHMPHWTSRRVALLGDAGYAVSPLAGQGASLALVGAYVLAGELANAQGDHAIAFAHYEKALARFVNENQKLARAGVKAMAENSVLAWLHQLLTRFIPKRWIVFLKEFTLKRMHKAANHLTLKSYQ